jgi:hypothetical protein
MEKPLEVSDMPPLTLELTERLRAMERDLRLALGSCCNNYNLVDREAAFEYVRSYAVRFYDCFYGFYSQIPDESYRPHWRPASERFAFQRVMKCVENISSVENLFFESGRKGRIQKTISDHAEPIAIPVAFPTMPLGKQASTYAASGVDIASGPPLLKMAATVAARGTHLQPPNVPSVWAPVLPATNKRIGRSIQSERAAQRMESYIQDKGITQTQFSVTVNADTKTLYRFRRTGKVEKSVAKRIADAMGITLEQFTA